jgi:hypothetical protein
MDPTRQELLTALDNAIKGITYDRDDATQKFIERSSKTELAALADALDIVERSKTDDTASLQWEASVIHDLLAETLPRRATASYAHVLLATRSALCWNRNEGEHNLIIWALPLYRGLISNQHGKPLPEKERLTIKQITAAMRYVYGVFNSGGAKELPINELFVGKGRNMYSILRYANPDLLGLITANADRVDAIIDMVISENTDDPSRLQAMLDSNSHTALISGAL